MSEYEEAIRAAGIPLDTSRWGGGYDAYHALWKEVKAGVPDGVAIARALKRDRNTFVADFGFAIPSEAALSAILLLAPVLEVGAGTGYWSYELAKRGADVMATDPFPIASGQAQYQFRKAWYPVEALSAVEAVTKYPARTLLLVWPSYEEQWPVEVLSYYSGQQLAYVGEGAGGCCADDAFFAELEECWERDEAVQLPQWSGIHDCLTIYRRKHG